MGQVLPGVGPPRLIVPGALGKAKREHRLDLGRTPNHHVAFGVASHRCIGMAAARMEITLLVEELARRGLRFALTGGIERLRSNFMLGIRHLPVELAGHR